MTIDSAKFIAMINEIQVDEDISARSYSGRGMYGESCVGVTCDNPFKVIAELAFMAGSDVAEENYSLAQDILQVLGETRSDSMGRSTIIYWPRVKWVETEDDQFVCYRAPQQGGQTCLDLAPNEPYQWCDGCAQEHDADFAS